MTPDLPSLHHENMVAALLRVGSQVPGRYLLRRDGVAAVFTGLPVVIFNQIFMERPGGAAATVEEAVSEARRRGHPFVLNLRVGPDDEWIPLADALGLVPISPTPWLPGMAKHPVNDERPSAQEGELLISKATDAASIEDHVRAASDGFEMPKEYLRLVMNEDVLRDADISVYAGYEAGSPVVAGMGMKTGRTIGVYNIATVPSARRRGYGGEMTRRIVADGVAAGCDVAILQASEMGFHLYEDLGFRTVLEYVGYVEPSA